MVRFSSFENPSGKISQNYAWPPPLQYGGAGVGATAGVMGGRRPAMDSFGIGHFLRFFRPARFASRPQTHGFTTHIVLLIWNSLHRSHFGSRYKLGCCGHAGLFVNGSRQPKQHKFPSRHRNFAAARYPLPVAGHDFYFTTGFASVSQLLPQLRAR